MSASEKELNLVMPMFQFNGAYYPSAFIKIENLLEIEKMKIQEGDIFLSSFPRSGSMWTQAIVWSILNSGKPLPQRLQVEFPHLELVNCNLLEEMHSPRTFKVHLPSSSLPKNSSAKYICIVRNIYDCCLSAYDFFSKNVVIMGGDIYPSLDRHVECFIEGTLPMGDYFYTCQSWYECRDEPNVLFLIYEEQRKDIKSGIVKIAKFLGQKYYDQISSCPDILEQIIQNTGLNSMKESKSHRAPDKAFNDDLLKETKEDKLESVPLDGTNSLNPKDLIFKGEVGRAQKGLTEKHRELLREALEAKIQSKELRDILEKI